MNKILILGASGFIGQTLYKELCSYFDVYGTYFSHKSFRDNQHFSHFNMEYDGIDELLSLRKPDIIISCLRGNFDLQLEVHHHLINYIKNTRKRLVFLSSSNVFDAFTNYPSYEYDKTLSESKYGRFKIKIENQLLRLPEYNYLILRLPMVFGKHSPRNKELKETLRKGEAYEVFPDLVMNVTTVDRLAQQAHYLLNRKKKGIYHLGSEDLIHHDEFIIEVCKLAHLKSPLFKNVYTSNFDRYLAVLPKEQLLPKHLRISCDEVIKDSGV